MNREIVGGGGASIYPLIGDVTSTAGNATVTVTGIQGIPIASPFLDGGAALVYNANAHNWQPILRATIQVNGLTVSDDFEISVNVPRGILVNGA